MIRYTLAVGRAPFHAAKREDIYRKLKAREYTWPDISKFPNEITDELRDIVSLLLVHEDDRPTPDQIVGHPFFRMGHVPLTLDNACTSRVPKWPKVRPPTAATIKRGYTEDWYELCKSSSVGEYESGKTFGAYGSRRNKTVARDCQKEIESGKQPNIPFAKDTVYLPFPERTHWPFQTSGGLSEIPEEKESSAEGPALVDASGNERQKGRLPRITRREEVLPPLKENQDPVQEPEIPRRTVDKQPTRMRAVRKISNPGRVTAATAAPVPLRVPKDPRPAVQRTRSTRESAKEKEAVPETEPLRIGKTATIRSETLEPAAMVQRPATKPSSTLKVLGSELPLTDPATVLARLYTFRDNVARALQRKRSASRHVEPPQLPYVSKWVDYSRKHGVGYVLEDNTVGCVAVANKHHPTTVAFIQDGHAHLSKISKNSGDLSEIPLEYYAHAKKESGLAQVDLMDEQRREGIQTIWQKFGRYMCAQLGVDVDERPRRKLSSTPNFVKFYQRLGNVGIWGFVDGSFQVCSSKRVFKSSSNLPVGQFPRPYEIGAVT